MKQPTVYALTAVHNYLNLTKKFIKCLIDQDYKKTVIVIVDDGSDDGTSEFISSHYKKILLIHGDGNLWWTGSLNKGINLILEKAKKDDYILTINNDCTFKKNYISQLMSSSREFKESIIGSCILDNKTEKIWDAGITMKWNYLSFYLDKNKMRSDIINKQKFSVNFDTLPSKGTLFPVKLISDIGNFDQKNFPHYLSDYEFFYRAKKSGYCLVVNYNAKVFNDVTRTGMGGETITKLSFKEYLNLMFSTKSKLNVIDQYNFVRLHSPLKYKPLNYLMICAKMVHYLFHVYPFSLILVSVLKIKKIVKK